MRDALDLKDGRVRLVVVQRDDAGASVVRRVEYNDAVASLPAGMPLSRLWTSGALGGVPNL